MKRLVYAFMLAAAALVGRPGFAHAASVQKVHEFFQVMDINKMVTDLIPGLTGAMVNGMRQGNTALPADVPEIVGKVVSDVMTPLIPEMEAATEKLYQDNLTDEELSAAIDFYRTPVGQRLLQKLPGIMEQGMQQGQAIVRAHIPEIQKRLQKELQKRHPELK